MRISDWSSDVCSSDLDFPMPPNLVITDGQFTEGSHAVQANFLVRGTSAESVNQVWGFFNDRLPEAGYELQKFQPLDAGATQARDRKGVGSGKSVYVRLDLGGRGFIKKKKITIT